VQISALCSSSKRHFFLFFSSNSTRSSSLSNDDVAGGCGASREQQSQPGPIPRLIARQHSTKHRYTEEEDEVCTERETPTKVQDLHERNQSFQNKDLPSDMDCAHHQGHSDPPLQCARREREREREIGRGATESVLDIGLNKLLQTSRRCETSNSPHIT
jgi:hypothetical protein